MVYVAYHYLGKIMEKTLPELMAELSRIESAIKAQKVMSKIQKTKVSNKSMYKYFDLQQAYVNSCKGT